MKKSICISSTILIIIRILLSFFLGIWFPANQIWDDNLMMRYVGLGSHFSNSEFFSLVKTISFPAFVKVMSFTHIPYTITLALLWVIAAVLVFFLVKKLSGKDYLSMFFFVYVLFMPQAFESWCGTRLYRNAIIAPFVIITLSLLVMLILRLSGYAAKLNSEKNDGSDSSKANKSKRSKANDVPANLIMSLILGFVFSFTYYIKEDGIWLLCCLLFGSLIAIINAIVKDKKKAFKKIAIVLIPMVVFILATLGYKAINYKFYGVFEINTRTEGEMGEFVEKIYKIESDDRNIAIWTPKDAILKAYDASPAFREHPELLEDILTTSTQGGDIEVNPIPGDHLGWILRTSLYDTGLWTNEKEVNDYFARINDDLDNAFKDGTLKEQKGRIQIISSAGGYTLEEIGSLFPTFREALFGSIFLKGYKAGLEEVTAETISENELLINAVNNYTNLSYLGDYSKIKPYSEAASKAVNIIFIIYRIINVCLVLSLPVAIVLEIINIIKKKGKAFYLLAILSSIGIALVYDFAICWFSEFLFVKNGINYLILNFYNIALPGLLCFAYIFANAAIFTHFDVSSLKNNSKKKQ